MDNNRLNKSNNSFYEDLDNPNITVSDLILIRICISVTLYTDDRYTTLRKGDEGTITDILETPEGNRQIWVRWDNGSS